MSNQAAFEGATLDLLKYLKSKKEAMQLRHAAELACIDKEIEAVSTTVRLLRETEDATGDPVEEFKPTVIPGDLHGLSTREACIEIAKKNGGLVKIGDATKVLVSSGILKQGKNTWGIVYTTLHRSKEFEKTKGPGQFRLITYATKEEAQASFLQ